jgi:hypothetical protein
MYRPPQDTIVFDPFYDHMPKYFNISFKELLASKHPTAWVEFEKGLINEDQLLAKFFADGRTFDGPGLISHMVSCSCAVALPHHDIQSYHCSHAHPCNVFTSAASSSHGKARCLVCRLIFAHLSCQLLSAVTFCALTSS